ncbi:Riboflavin synthase [Stieleria bergensis]|uniref:Riboflavin synthase n=1 Tax=Stieleria bergensis TaxID=2528025 RepID=A0A517SW49_9BACT|nr:MAG: riboflavin synthase [Rhodopirellula sp. TMED11]QDT60356.1 Riboflavin synthase [Planctomycetes bacterium SV_7m_r]
MFTGLVETKGQIADVISAPPGKRLRVRSELIASDVAIGDSICINGCCLTVIAIDGDVLDFEAGEETLSRTNLGLLKSGSEVNLERSLAIGARMGGHYVSGHIDCQGQLVSRIEDPPWANLHFKLPKRYASQVAAKGSIAIDGVSLTVVEVTDEQFSVALIPHTLSVTSLGNLSVGDPVNLETDILAKYVQRSLGMIGDEDLPESIQSITK